MNRLACGSGFSLPGDSRVLAGFPGVLVSLYKPHQWYYIILF